MLRLCLFCHSIGIGWNYRGKNTNNWQNIKILPIICDDTRKKANPIGSAFCSFPKLLDWIASFLAMTRSVSYADYIIPSIPPPIGIGGVGGVGSLWLLMTHSVVSNIPAMEAAFSKATLDTFTGSMTPVVSRFS